MNGEESELANVVPDDGMIASRDGMRARDPWEMEQSRTRAKAPIILPGVMLIEAERRRQIESEGWSAEHDDEHNCGELAHAAICYALPLDTHNHHSLRMELWPWAEGWWKPSTNEIRNLVKAGALIAAEIDRQLRESA